MKDHLLNKHRVVLQQGKRGPVPKVQPPEGSGPEATALQDTQSKDNKCWRHTAPHQPDINSSIRNLQGSTKASFLCLCEGFWLETCMQWLCVKENFSRNLWQSLIPCTTCPKEEKSMRSFVGKLLSHTHQQVIEKLYQDKKAELQTKLLAESPRSNDDNTAYAAVTLDAWSRSDRTAYLTVTAHWITDQWQLTSAVLTASTLEV